MKKAKARKESFSLPSPRARKHRPPRVDTAPIRLERHEKPASAARVAKQRNAPPHALAAVAAGLIAAAAGGALLTVLGIQSAIILFSFCLALFAGTGVTAYSILEKR